MTQIHTQAAPKTYLCAIPPIRIGTMFITKKAGKRPAEKHTVTEVRFDKVVTQTSSAVAGVEINQSWSLKEFLTATDNRPIAEDLYKILTTMPKQSEIA